MNMDKKTVYDFTVKDKAGNDVSLEEYKGKVLLIVNTASKCGFAPQLAILENMNNDLKDKGFEVLGFPCGQFNNQEFGKAEETEHFCQVNYGVNFKLFQKIDVNGPLADPLFVHLRNETRGFFGDKVKWNFTKFLIDRDGNVVKRFSPAKNPEAIRPDIEALL